MSMEGPLGKPERVHVKCPNCGGRGTVKEDGKETTCRRCSGTGQIAQS